VISYGKQAIYQDDIDAVVEALRSDFLTQGSKVPEFEKGLSVYCGSKYATAVANGTAALHLAYLAVGVTKGDVVWTVPNTFVSTANAARYCGAEVEFVDIDIKTYNLSIEALKLKLEQAQKGNQLPKLVVPVHFAGQSCEMQEIWALSQEYGFYVIEDASHALGGEYLGKKIGSCEFSHAAVFSFHPVKMITTGEGGAVMTNDQVLNDKIQLLRSHGITKKANQFKHQTDGDWYYEQQLLGFNYRLTDIQAALGISQLRKLDYFVARRREIAQLYLSKLRNVTLPFQHPDAKSSWHLFVIQTKDREKVYQQLKAQGILTQVHYIPVNSQPFYGQPALKNSADFYQHCLSLPIYVDLDAKDQKMVINSL